MLGLRTNGAPPSGGARRRCSPLNLDRVLRAYLGHRLTSDAPTNFSPCVHPDCIGRVSPDDVVLVVGEDGGRRGVVTIGELKSLAAAHRDRKERARRIRGVYRRDPAVLAEITDRGFTWQPFDEVAAYDNHENLFAVWRRSARPPACSWVRPFVGVRSRSRSVRRRRTRSSSRGSPARPADDPPSSDPALALEAA